MKQNSALSAETGTGNEGKQIFPHRSILAKVKNLHFPKLSMTLIWKQMKFFCMSMLLVLLLFFSTFIKIYFLEILAFEILYILTYHVRW